MTREQKLDAELRDILVELDASLEACLEAQMISNLSWPQKNEYEVQGNRIKLRIDKIKFALSSEDD